MDSSSFPWIPVSIIKPVVVPGKHMNVEGSRCRSEGDVLSLCRDAVIHTA
jgi:hypothetical protein